MEWKGRESFSKATARPCNAKIGHGNAKRCLEQQRQSGETLSKGNAQRSKAMQWNSEVPYRNETQRNGIDKLGSAAA